MKRFQRKDYIKKVIHALDNVPIIVLIGARQVGKTTLMKSLPEEFYLNSIFLNGQDSEIAEIFQKYSTIRHFLNAEVDVNSKAYIYIDEFQYIDNISTMLKLITDDNSNLQFICSGSSSLDILQNVNESLAGRVRIINIYSLSFAEYLLFNDEKIYDKFCKYNYEINFKAVDSEIINLFNEYLIYGGLPRAAKNKGFKNKQEIINDIYQTYLLKDVRSYIKNEDFVGFNKLLRILSAQIGNLVNVNELSGRVGLSYNRCEEYIYLLEQMYIIKLIEPFHNNKKKEITKMKKIYFLDLGLRNIIYGSFNDIEIRRDNGAIFENYTLLEILKHGSPLNKINFYRTINGSEIDFLVDNLIEKRIIECKFSKYNGVKNIRAISAFKEKYGDAVSYVFNKNYYGKSEMMEYIPGIFISKVEM